MYNIIISLFVVVLLTVLLLFTGLPWWGGLLIALPLGGIVFFLIARAITNRFVTLSEGAAKDLQSQRIDKAIRDLEQAVQRYGRWQIFITGQVNSQIGMIHYLRRDFAKAFPYLEKGFVKNWVGVGMLAVSYMKRQKRDKMRQTFERGVQWNSKEPLLWNLYAYCLNEIGDPGKAKEVMTRALKKNPGDERLQHNLTALQEGKRMKMKSFGEFWLQFHLESPGALMRQQAASMGVRRKVVR